MRNKNKMRTKTPSLKQRKTLLQNTINKSIELKHSKALITTYKNQLLIVCNELEQRNNKLNTIKENGGISIY